MLSEFRRSGRVSKERNKRMKSRAEKVRQRILTSRGRARFHFGVQKKDRGATALC
jgi:hypothetical protein